MQPLRKASSTAGESVKRLNEEADGLSGRPEMTVAETASEPAECEKQTLIIIWNAIITLGSV